MTQFRVLWGSAGILLTILLSALVASHARADDRESALKVAFLYRFATLTTWSDSAFSDGDEALRFGIVGDDRLATRLRETVGDKRVKGRMIDIEVVDGSQAGDCCHVVYLANPDAERVTEVLRLTGGRPVLTVSDAATFVDVGGMIQMERDGRKLRFSINRRAAAAGDLKISSKLLKLATRVVDGEAG